MLTKKWIELTIDTSFIYDREQGFLQDSEAAADTIYEQLINALAELYNYGTERAVVVGELCDEILDRSGAMLGEVRKVAEYRRENGIDN